LLHATTRPTEMFCTQCSADSGTIMAAMSDESPDSKCLSIVHHRSPRLIILRFRDNHKNTSTNKLSRQSHPTHDNELGL